MKVPFRLRLRRPTTPGAAAVAGSAPTGTLADVAARFRAHWAGPGDPDTAQPELLPVRLASAAAAVLGADGAGLSLIDADFRVPLGACDALASLAERLQFTYGEGPCLDAAHRQRAVVATSADIARQWPLYARDLFGRSPFRAVVSLPYVLTSGERGALDLMYADERRVGELLLADVMTVVREIELALDVATSTTASTDGIWRDVPSPVWMHGPGVEARTRVWIAAGMLMTRFDLPAPDALLLLRSHAYSDDVLLDDLAADVVAGAVALEAFGP